MGAQIIVQPDNKMQNDKKPIPSFIFSRKFEGQSAVLTFYELATPHKLLNNAFLVKKQFYFFFTA
jgi:hypothetical protein